MASNKTTNMMLILKLKIGSQNENLLFHKWYVFLFILQVELKYLYKNLNSLLDRTERKKVFLRRACIAQCAESMHCTVWGESLPFGLIVVGGREGVSHPDGSRGRGRGSFTFNCGFIFPTILFHHGNLEVKTIHSDELFQILTEINKNGESSKQGYLSKSNTNTNQKNLGHIGFTYTKSHY